MVRKEPGVCLFIGQDAFAKDRAFARVKADFLRKDTQEFNLDILYGKDLALKILQETLAQLPLSSQKRIVVIKNTPALRKEIKDFLCAYVKNPHPHILLVLDALRYEPADKFLGYILKYSQVFRFREERTTTVFDLSRQLELKKADSSLRLLHRLLQDGKKPELILGGLRYNWEKKNLTPQQLKEKVKFLLRCELEIKRGRLKPSFALEKLVVGLCYLKNTFS